ncbi:MAG: DEAD/DEAH box helicase, partial [Thermoanaerobaculia bacterium]
MPASLGGRANIPLAVRHLIDQYRRFLRTSYRFLDEHLRRQFEEHLARIDVVVKGPYVTLAREFHTGNTLGALIAADEADAELARLRWPFGSNPLYVHQERALALGRAGQSFVVTTGTGSGKTESFLLPVLDGVLRRKREGVRGVQAILLYPMNALANDQLERLRRLLRGTGVDLSFALYTGDSDATTMRLQEEPAETERLKRADIRTSPPDLLLTNYKQLEFLLVRREDRALFGPALRYLVLDEVHSYRGALATEIACLIRRLKARAGVEPGELLAIGTSATVASGDEGRKALAAFASTLFGERVDEEALVIEARKEAP